VGSLFKGRITVASVLSRVLTEAELNSALAGVTFPADKSTFYTALRNAKLIPPIPTPAPTPAPAPAPTPTPTAFTWTVDPSVTIDGGGAAIYPGTVLRINPGLTSPSTGIRGYRWFVGGVNIGLNSVTFTVRSADVGKTIAAMPLRTDPATGTDIPNLKQSALVGPVQAAPVSDTAAPSITSANPSGSYDEAVAVGGTLTANEAVTWGVSGTDASAVSLNATTGAWSLAATDFETQASYVFAFVATDAAGNASAPQSVSIEINNVAEGGPLTSLDGVTSYSYSSAPDYIRSADPSVMQLENGWLRLTATADKYWPEAVTELTGLTVGAVYNFSAKVPSMNASSGFSVRVGTPSDPTAAALFEQTYVTFTGTITGQFTATATTHSVYYNAETYTAGEYVDFDLPKAVLASAPDASGYVWTSDPVVNLPAGATEPRVGMTLTVTKGTTSPSTGTKGYRWFVDGVRIGGSMSAFTISPEHQGGLVSCAPVHIKADGTEIVRESAKIGPVLEALPVAIPFDQWSTTSLDASAQRVSDPAAGTLTDGTLRLAARSGSTMPQAAAKMVGLVAGYEFTVAVDVPALSAGGGYSLWVAQQANLEDPAQWQLLAQNVAGPVQGSFVALQGEHWIMARVNGAVAGEYADFRNFTYVWGNRTPDLAPVTTTYSSTSLVMAPRVTRRSLPSNPKQTFAIDVTDWEAGDDIEVTLSSDSDFTGTATASDPITAMPYYYTTTALAPGSYQLRVAVTRDGQTAGTVLQFTVEG